MKKYLLFIVAVIPIVSFAGPVEDAKNALTSEYKNLRARQSITMSDLERLYGLLEACLDLLKEPTGEQINEFIRSLVKLSTQLPEIERVRFDPASYAVRYRTHRAQVNDRRSMARQQSVYPFPGGQSVARPPLGDPFAIKTNTMDTLNRIVGDLDQVKKANTAAARKKYRALAMLLRTLAIGQSDFIDLVQGVEELDLEETANILYEWLQGFVARQVQKNAASDEQDADQIRQFAIRQQALLTFAEARGLNSLRIRLIALRGNLGQSEQLRAKQSRAEAAMLRTRSCVPDSRGNSFYTSRGDSTISQATSFRGLAPARSQSVMPANNQVAVLLDGTRINITFAGNSGGGECLFLAAGTTRTNLIQWVLANMDTNTGIQELFNQAILADEIDDVNAWLNRMFAPDFEGWGGDLEIGLIALMTNTQIVVFTQQPDGNWATPHVHGPQAAANHIWVGYNGGHYVTLVTNDQQAVPLLQREQKSGKITIEQLQAAIKQAVLIGRFNLAHNLENAQAIIEFINESGQTITKDLRDKLLAAGFKITGSKGKYVITQVAQTGHTNSHNDRGPPPPPGAGAAGGGSGGSNTGTDAPASKKSRTEGGEKQNTAHDGKGARGRKASGFVGRIFGNTVSLAAKMLVTGLYRGPKSRSIPSFSTVSAN